MPEIDKRLFHPTISAPWSRPLRVFVAAIVLLVATASPATADVEPAEVELNLSVGESVNVDKTVSIPVTPSSVDICVLLDRSRSFERDLVALRANLPSVLDLDVSRDMRFGLAGFIDYPQAPFGFAGDVPYELLAPTGDRASFVAALEGLTLGRGADPSEAQLDAVIAAVGPGADDCGWRPQPVARVLVATTDSLCHGPDGTHQASSADAVAAMLAARVTFIGLVESADAIECFESLAAGTGGALQPVQSDAADLAAAVTAALDESLFRISPMLDPDCVQLGVTFDPPTLTGLRPNVAVDVAETVTLTSADSSDPIQCIVDFGAAGTQTIIVNPAIAASTTTPVTGASPTPTAVTQVLPATAVPATPVPTTAVPGTTVPATAAPAVPSPVTTTAALPPTSITSAAPTLTPVPVVVPQAALPTVDVAKAAVDPPKSMSPAAVSKTNKAPALSVTGAESARLALLAAALLGAGFIVMGVRSRLRGAER